jgi:hypothetical protein
MNSVSNVDLIERYVAAVGRELPKNLRGDVENELRSSLLDTLEDRMQAKSDLNQEQVVVEILQSMDAPKRMAQRFSGRRALIGPAIYPAFVVTIRIAMIVLAVLYLVGILVGINTLPEGQWMAQLGGSLVGLIVSALSSFGGLVLLFIALERVALGGADLSKDRWDPEGLPTVTAPDLVRPFSLVMKIVFALALIALFDFFPQWVGVSYYRSGQWNHVPALTGRFFSFLLPIHILLVAVMLFNLYLLRRGVWDQRSRWIQFGLTLFQLVMILAMVRGPAVWEVSAVGMIPVGGGAFDADPLLWLWLVLGSLRFGRWIATNRLYASIPITRWQESG